VKTGKYANANVYLIGGSSGIGLAAAKEFSSLGADVIIFGRTEKRLQEACTAIAGCRLSDSQRFDGRTLDIAVEKDVQSVLPEAVAAFGVPHIVVNCAGRAYPGYFPAITGHQFRETLAVNFCGMWYCLQALLPHMRETGGRIVNVSSMAGFMGIFGFTDYCASKFAVIGFSEALRSELRPCGIHVSVLCPPDTDTPGFQVENQTKPVETERISGNIKPMSAQDVARAMVAGMEKGKFIIIPGGEGKMVFLLKRLFPGLLTWIMDRKVARRNP